MAKRNIDWDRLCVCKVSRKKNNELFFFVPGSFSPFVQNATSTCSVLTIMAISYERYIAICQPLKVDYSNEILEEFLIVSSSSSSQRRCV